ncbi:unnamed protein product [Rotaria socialis]|uniref:Uncharacterized protein n=1 Tax=Rotaria socialis TaxID=392032 RepID=A0A818FIY6_9BILA|nr:unnamed protein product [Rotaria socialis]CAF3414296.1 unnamed protein product [Rotaria socialis]CAF3476355.1 unnamed protein product [Rotaria socialis]CAF3492427.1 unnamed protein product [Rotaria socialis]CAF3550794.1 unnamed protein product [Rotaria socialis]
MLLNNQVPSGEYRHNFVRLIFLIGSVIFFIGFIFVDQLFEQGNTVLKYSGVLVNRTYRVEQLYPNDITPSNWVYRSLDVFNYFWQLAWLLYSLSFIFRRSATGYLYLSPNTLTPTFSIVYVLGFLIQTIWLLFFQKNYTIWSWIIYLVSFLLLSLALFIINNNLAVNKKIYETEGFDRDVWCLRFFAQNGVAFFACWAAVRFVLTFDIFLQVQCNLSVLNAGTICLSLAAVLAGGFFFGTNFNAALVERCAYQFSPWVIFIIFFWGVVENNWISKDITRNNIIAGVELLVSLVSAVLALALFTMRYRASKIDPIA